MISVKKILILIFCIIIIGIILYAVYSPKLTTLSITEPVELKNTEIGEIYYKNYVVDQNTKEVQIKGVTEPGADVKAYVVYDNINFEYSEVPDFFKNYSSDNDPGASISTAKHVGKQYSAEFNQNREFIFTNIPVIGYLTFGDTYIYITANSQGKEENVLEIIVTRYDIEAEISNPSQTTDSDFSESPTAKCPNCGSTDVRYVGPYSNPVTNKDLQGYICNVCDTPFGVPK